MCHGVGPDWRIKAISNVASGWVKKQADAFLLHLLLISLSTIIKSLESITEMGSKMTQQFPQVLKLLTRCKVQGGCQWKIDNFDSCLSSEAEHERKPKNTYLKIGWVLTEMRYLHNRNALPPEAADLLSLKCDRGLFLDLGFLFCVPLVHRAHCLPSCLLNEIFSNHLIIVPNPQLPAWPILLPAFFFFLSQLRVMKNLRFQPDLQA